MTIFDLKVNPIFEALIPKLTDEEFKQLKDNIAKDKRVFSPIFEWDGFIVDGHSRCKILEKMTDIPYEIKEMQFADVYEAKAWICCYQLGRRNLTPENKKILVGEKYAAERHEDTCCGNQYTLARESGVVQNEPPHFSKKAKKKQHGTRSKVAKETGTSESYVYRADLFNKGVHAADSACPGIRRKMLNGEIRASDKEMADILKASDEDRKEMAEDLLYDQETRKKRREERAQKKAMRENLERLSAQHANLDRLPVSTEKHLESFVLTAERFLGTCDSFFRDAPELISNDTFRVGVVEVGEKFINYFTKIKENNYEPYIV